MCTVKPVSHKFQSAICYNWLHSHVNVHLSGHNCSRKVCRETRSIAFGHAYIRDTLMWIRFESTWLAIVCLNDMYNLGGLLYAKLSPMQSWLIIWKHKHGNIVKCCFELFALPSICRQMSDVQHHRNTTENSGLRVCFY